MSQREETSRLKTELDQAVRKDKSRDALRIVASLERAEPDEPRWPHRRGDLNRKLADTAAAVAAYERATELYVARGMIARAVAMAKTILLLDSTRTSILE